MAGDDRLAPSERHAYKHGGRVVYEWDQAYTEVNIYVPVPPGTRAKQLYCDLTPHTLKFGLTPNPPYLQGNLAAPIKVSESFWTLEDGVLHVTLQKAQPGEPWPCAIAGHEVDAVTQQQDTQRLMLERFQMEHPGFDFSGATFSGEAPNPRTFMGGGPAAS
uniref:CS domain-containing protein n=1 Tax=Chlamydomonas leiostraca TaxID=1034604 RepID=A0A7S0RNW8_9CHLO|mmetsp:Transcript_27286/g.69468  ORF Transcript_27286/g.69468 Transcript_27286/m.69468 type:complete len:161 (+) Transcript_27286:194-676(+)|eukprot:CAMPEP_0202867002 /NCGR_PEP_ID=MMETSP1391-20130828/8475_1 /ASSEMBLY_ACC=CAM_ASM_000867 /TAXON_ID=1034604 /ORGANISM="Chlamydomonas leiostraca, Strain SAG 11-49" /LENGTH=160 /DNA_ID=CAMNT_0049546997 /DNA_START=179 /DNA_END=661 /DNA_ORIENTATION=-